MVDLIANENHIICHIKELDVSEISYPVPPSIENLIGCKFGKLTVTAFAGRDKHKKPKWHCKCECGNYKIAIGADIKAGKTTSCGCYHKLSCSNNGKMSVRNLIGMKFGKLTVIKQEGLTSYNNATWVCKCECGNYKTIRSGNLISGCTNSCGCNVTEHAVLLTKAQVRKHLLKESFSDAFNKEKYQKEVEEIQEEYDKELGL